MIPSSFSSFMVSSEAHDARLDRWFTRHFPGISQAMVQKNLRQKKIRLNGLKTTTATRLQKGDSLSIHLSLIKAQQPSLERPQPIVSRETLKRVKEVPSWILREEPGLLILNKPQGLATQGGTGLKTSVDEILNLFLKEKNQKAYLVHRLDKDTTGLLLVALTPSMATALGALFQNREIQKTYWAICGGVPPQLEGRHEMWMAKRPGRNGEKMELTGAETSGALQAICTYRVLDQGDDMSLVELHPQTGRTHQLRLQMATLGCPILGDGKYGGKKAHTGGRHTVHLHAMSLQFKHPQTHKDLKVSAPLPPHFQETFQMFLPNHPQAPCKD